MIFGMIAATVIQLASICADVRLEKAINNTDVKTEGLLIIGQHDSRLQIAPFVVGPKPACSVFIVFPGTPSFLTPGYDWEWTRVPAVSVFSQEYQRRSREKGFSPARVVVIGTFLSKEDFKRLPNGRANGFGYRGAYRLALLLKSIEYAR